MYPGIGDYPTVEDIVYGMGEMLGYLHWHVGYDGRDVEFIMGGASFSGIAMNIIDFNQVRRLLESADVQIDILHLRCVPGRGRRTRYISLLKLSSSMIHIILALALKTPLSEILPRLPGGSPEGI